MHPAGRERSVVRWSPRAALAAVVFSAFIAFQLVVPLLGLAAPKPARFGWQMYASAGHTWSAYSLVLPDGSREGVDVHAEIGYGRPDVRFDDHLPGHLCARFPDATALMVHPPESGQAWRHPCP